MSKQVVTEVICEECGRTSKAQLFRSIWGEYPEYREIVFDNTINVVPCFRCGMRTRAPFSLLYVDAKRQFAVWYEPRPDPVVEHDTAFYRASFGPESYYATAPRVSDWEEFKHTILKFERGELQAKPISLPGSAGIGRTRPGAASDGSPARLLPAGMAPPPCHACGRGVDLMSTRCPNCLANLLVVVCPACASVTPRDSKGCIACARELPGAYRSLSDIETRELFAVELMLHANATSDQVAPDQRQNIIRLWGLYKRRLLKQITQDEFHQGQIDMSGRFAETRAATLRKKGCAR